jgi:hypothetical protein
MAQKRILLKGEGEGEGKGKGKGKNTLHDFNFLSSSNEWPGLKL